MGMRISEHHFTVVRQAIVHSCEKAIIMIMIQSQILYSLKKEQIQVFIRRLVKM